MNRFVFDYFDGLRTQYGDPLAIYTTLGEELKEHPEAVLKRLENTEDADYLAGCAKFIDAARVAFKMAPFNAVNGTGATAEDVYTAVNKLWAYFESKKKLTATPQNSLDSMAHSGPSPTGTRSSDSGKIDTGYVVKKVLAFMKALGSLSGWNLARNGRTR